MQDLPLCLIQVSKQEILAKDTSRVIDILDSFIPNLLERNRNGVQIEVNGYNADKRELFHIDEVREYFKTLFENVPHLFYWMDFNSFMPLFLGLMLYKPMRVSGQVTISSRNLQEFVYLGFLGLNEFCTQHHISVESTNNLINKWLNDQVAA